MEDQGFRQFYQALISGYYLPHEAVKNLLGKILSSLSPKKKESDKMSDRSYTPELIADAIRGEDAALSFLYESTQDKVTQTVRSMIRDEDAVLDIVQDSYVKAFRNLDKLDKPEYFVAWMRRIATNTAVDYMKKKRPVLFSELASEDGTKIEFEDENIGHLPDVLLDQQETSRLIQEIVSDLSEEQQLAIGLFYFEEMPIKNIAKKLGCSENTVKSRLNYGRKNIEKQVRELEKKGTKLYSLAPLPFFLWLLRNLHSEPSQNMLGTVLAECADLSSGAAATTNYTAAQAGATSSAVKAGGKAVSSAAKKLTTKIVACILAVVAVGGGAALAIFGGSSYSEPTEEPAVIPIETTVPPTTESIPVCEVNGHTWVDATCETAKTCSVCGETEGDALGHSWADANYQAPKTCSVCGTTEGEALTAAFEENGLTINVTELDTEYDYVTACYPDETKQTVGKLTISNYRVFEGDETHPALEGYEWHAVTVTVRFDDENAWNYGCGIETCRENYYDVVGWDESSTHLEEESMYQYTVNFNGVDYTECLYEDSGEYTWSEWVDKACTCTFERYIRIPVGYDGIVLGFYDSSIEWGDGQYIFDIADENTLFFRLDGTGAEYAE